MNLVFSLYKEPSLYFDFGLLKEEDFKTEEARFYYFLGLNLFNSKFSTFDEMSITNYLTMRPKEAEKFELYGGYQTVKEIMSIVNPENIEGYYHDFVKGIIVSKLIISGFDLEEVDIKDKTVDDIYNHFEAKLNSIFLETNNSSQIEEMQINDLDLQQLNDGMEMGYNFGEYAHILNYKCMGLPKGEITLIAGSTNSSKTTFSVSMILYPLIKSGIKGCMMSNEQHIIKIKTMLLAVVLFRELKLYSMNRKKIRTGNYTKDQWDVLNKGKDKFNELLKDMKFVKMYDYNTSKIKKVMRVLSAQGYEVFCFDTFKSDTTLDNGKASWENLVNDSKELHQLCGKLGVSLLISMQNNQTTNNRSIMATDMLSSAKGIMEVVAESFMIRRLDKSEYTGGDYDCKPYKFVTQRGEDGKYSMVKGADGKPMKEYMTLDPDKEYIVLFHVKTRSDTVGTQLIYEFVGDFAIFYEIGYANIVERKKW